MARRKKSDLGNNEAKDTFKWVDMFKWMDAMKQSYC